MKQPKTSSMLKADAKGQLLGKYGTVISAFLLVNLFQILLTGILFYAIDLYTFWGTIIYNLLIILSTVFSGLFSIGKAFLTLNIATNRTIQTYDIFYAFRTHTDKSVKLCFLIAIIDFVCNLPYVIANFYYMQFPSEISYAIFMAFWIFSTLIIYIISLMLSQVFFLMVDLPRYSATELIKLSIRIMKGHKGRLFYIQLSFIGLLILGILSCGIAFLWIAPYIEQTMANFYLDLMKIQE